MIGTAGDHWRKYAEEARTMAGNMTSEEAQQTMLRIAQRYDRLAAGTEKRELPAWCKSGNSS